MFKLSSIGEKPSWNDVKKFVTTEYKSEESFSHLVLIGDANHVPPTWGSGYSYSVSDTGYVRFGGFEDYHLDAFVSRLSGANAAEIDAQIDKLERYSPKSREEWKTTGLGEMGVFKYHKCL